MKNIISSILLLSLISCSNYSTRKIASNVIVQHNIIDIHQEGRQQFINLEIFPLEGINLEERAKLIFANNSIYEVQLLEKNINEFSLKTTIPFLFKSEDTILRVYQSDGKFYDLPLY